MGQSEALAPTSSTNTRRSAFPLLANSRQAQLKNSSRSPAPSDLVFGSIQGALASGSQRLPYRDSGCFSKELAPLGESGCWTLFEVRFQKLQGYLAHLRAEAGAPLRGKRAALLA